MHPPVRVIFSSALACIVLATLLLAPITQPVTAAALPVLSTPGHIGPDVCADAWTAGWTTAEFYEIAGTTYLFLLKRDDGTVHIQRMNPDGGVGERVATYDWSDGWSVVRPFYVGSSPYLFHLKTTDGTVHVSRLNSDGAVGSLVFSEQWTNGWTTAEFYTIGGTTYLMLLKKDGGAVHIQKMNADGSVGPRVATYDWSDKWTIVRPFLVSGTPYLLLLKTVDGSAHIHKLNGDGTVGERIADSTWAAGWTSAEFYEVGGSTCILLLKEEGGLVQIYRMDKSGWTSEKTASYDWDDGWSVVEPFSVGSGKYLFVLKTASGSMAVKQLSADPSMLTFPLDVRDASAGDNKGIIDVSGLYATTYGGKVSYYSSGGEDYTSGHYGTDYRAVDMSFAGCKGTPVSAVADGTVVRVTPTYGAVFIKHSVPLTLYDGSHTYGTWYTVYAHMSDIAVSKGQSVTQGAIIGKVSDVGAEKAHLHFAMTTKLYGGGNGFNYDYSYPGAQDPSVLKEYSDATISPNWLAATFRQVRYVAYTKDIADASALQRITRGTDNAPPDTPIAAADSSTPGSTLRISGTDTLPAVLYAGKTHSIKGIITSNYDISSVTVGVYAGASRSPAFEKTATPHSREYDIHALDNYILFDKLTVGTYTYEVAATDSSGRSVKLILKSFTVTGSAPPLARRSTPFLYGVKDYAYLDDTFTQEGCALAALAMLLSNSGVVVCPAYLYHLNVDHLHGDKAAIESWADLVDLASGGRLAFGWPGGLTKPASAVGNGYKTIDMPQGRWGTDEEIQASIAEKKHIVYECLERFPAGVIAVFSGENATIGHNHFIVLYDHIGDSIRVCDSSTSGVISLLKDSWCYTTKYDKKEQSFWKDLIRLHMVYEKR